MCCSINRIERACRSRLSMRLKHTAAKVWGHSVTSFVPCSLRRQSSKLQNTEHNFSSLSKSEFKTKSFQVLNIWNKVCILTFSPASRLLEGRSQEYWSGTGALSSLHLVHRCRWVGRNWRSKWKLAHPIMALTSGRHPSLITRLLTEWAIWAAENAATGPLPSWWPCPLGAAPARQPGRAGRGRRSSFTPPSWSLYSRCYDSSAVAKKESPHSAYLTQLVSWFWTRVPVVAVGEC